MKNNSKSNRTILQRFKRVVLYVLTFPQILIHKIRGIGGGTMISPHFLDIFLWGGFTAIGLFRFLSWEEKSDSIMGISPQCLPESSGMGNMM